LIASAESCAERAYGPRTTAQKPSMTLHLFRARLRARGDNLSQSNINLPARLQK
jgi:hypothetical protein